MAGTKGDQSLALLREGYPFISRRCARLGTDVFDTRLMLRPTTCVTGREGAEVFYDATRMRRAGAMPGRVVKTLLGRGGVQLLDGDAHRDRKAVLLSLASGKQIDALAARTSEEWRRAKERWKRGDQVVLLTEARNVLTRAACAWAGVPLRDDEVARRAADLDALIRGAGALGIPHWRSRAARRRCEDWIGTLIERVREVRETEQPPDALHTLAFHRNGDGNLLDARVAAVELLNLLRPTVALSIYIAFAAHALHVHAEARPRPGDAAERERFVHEVRRVYPFFPFAAAVVAEPFEWRGHPFPAGRRVLLDLYGTCRDARIWDAPEAFRPERFETATIDAYTLIPQGGGEHRQNHRCAGEWITIRLVSDTVRFLSEELRYHVAPQNLAIDLARIPTQPSSGFVIVSGS